jgi:hypothetical protein
MWSSITLKHCKVRATLDIGAEEVVHLDIPDSLLAPYTLPPLISKSRGFSSLQILLP